MRRLKYLSLYAILIVVSLGFSYGLFELGRWEMPSSSWYVQAEVGLLTFWMVYMVESALTIRPLHRIYEVIVGLCLYLTGFPFNVS